MLEKIMFWALLGHFIGDYLLQSKKMALGKSERTWKGVGICVWHSYFYTVAVCVMVTFCAFPTWHSSPPGIAWAYPMVFLSHYPIDRWSLGGWWLKMIGGRPLIEHPGILRNPENSRPLPEVVAVNQAFAAIVYVVVDNTLHILLMTAGFAALLHWGLI